jgi:hypothetical protein
MCLPGDFAAGTWGLYRRVWIYRSLFIRRKLAYNVGTLPRIKTESRPGTAGTLVTPTGDFTAGGDAAMNGKSVSYMGCPGDFGDTNY